MNNNNQNTNYELTTSSVLIVQDSTKSYNDSTSVNNPLVN